MKKFTMLFACLLMLGIHVANAQQRTITGSVSSSDDDMGLPGVSVSVKGTTIGTITNVDGKYSLEVGADAPALVFSFVGMTTKEVVLGTTNVINVVMEPDVIGVDEVIVTALGIKKSKKALGYAVSEFKSEDMERVQVVDATQALTGRVAGVSISPTSGAPGASTSVTVRGISSLSQSNQPLYVIDGVPVNNEYAGGNDTQSRMAATLTVDFGNAASDINPADIESMSVLKGAAATSLYGSRAANGAIIITTKSGKKGQDMKIDFNHSTSITAVGRLPYYQSDFGQGWSGHYASNENGSWGAEINGLPHTSGNVVDNKQEIIPYKNYENSLRDFYEYGTSFNNSVAISGGTQDIGYYASYSNTSQDGVIPGDVDVLDRNTFTFKGNGGTEKTKISFSANYTNKKISAVATGQSEDSGGGKAVFQELLQQPITQYIPHYEDYDSEFANLDNYYTPYAQNPYFIINENGNDFEQNRLISSLNLSHKIMDGLSVSWNGGLDTYSSVFSRYGAVAAITPDSPNSSANDVVGLAHEESRTVTQMNSDFLINYNGMMNVGTGELEYDVILGNNINSRYNERLTVISRGLVVPEYYNVQNISGSADVSTDIDEKRTVGLFGTLSLNYNDFLYMQVSGRNDWSSTLPTENNSFFYPGINLGFIFSEIMPSNNVLTYGKVRAGYALAGNDGPAYALQSTYGAALVRAGGYGTTQYPVAGNPAYEKLRKLGNANLANELSKELEIGADLRFLNNRIGLDVSYYNKVTSDLIIDATIAASSGFDQWTTNLGQITNSGIELKLDLTPVKTNDFRWNITYIFNSSSTMVDELNAELGVSEYIINTAYQTDLVAIPGEELGQFRIPDFKYAPDGSIIVGDNGLPLEGDKINVGSAFADYKMSFINDLSYKGVSLNFLVDYSQGGSMYSYTSNITFWSGNNEQSTVNDRRPYIVPNSVREVTAGDGTVSYVENTAAINDNWHDYYSSNTNRPIESNRIIDKTYIKLRELSLNYSLPTAFVQKAKLSSASIGVFGTNLFLWTAANNSFVDPETSSYGNGIEGLFGEFGGAPQVRTYGFKLNLSF